MRALLSTFLLIVLAPVPANCEEPYVGDWKIELYIDNGIPINSHLMLRRKDWIWQLEKKTFRVLDNGTEVVSYEVVALTEANGVYKFDLRYNGKDEEYKAHMAGRTIRGIMKIEDGKLLRCFWTKAGYPPSFDVPIVSTGDGLVYQKFNRAPKK